MDSLVERPQTPLRMSLDPPIYYGGKSYSELVFDFAGLTDANFKRAERTLLNIYKAERLSPKAIRPEIHRFNCILTAQAAKVPLGLITSLPGRYYRALRIEHLKIYAARRQKRLQNSRR